MKELFTIQQIGKELGVPESTLRYWRDRHEEYIPTQGTGRQRRYPIEAVAVFRRIAELAAEELTAEQVAERLRLEFTREITIAEDNSSNAAATVNVIEALRQIAVAQQEIVKIVTENKELKVEMEMLKARVEKQESAAEERDRKLMEVLREIQEQKQKKSFWQRLMGR
jgi:DNA-binding transcriptional MerR regulator